MKLSKIKLFGLLTLSYSLIACGQTQASIAPNVTSSATPSTIAQPTVAAQPTEKPAIVEKSPEPQPSAVASTKVETAIAQSPINAETLHQTFDEISKQRCDDRKSTTDKKLAYSVCTANAGGRGQFRFISASEYIAEAPDVGGITYWYYLNGKVAAVSFSHDGRSFMFDQSNKLQAELIRAKKVMVNGQEQFQERSILTNFTKSERDRLEKLAEEGGKKILSKFQ